MLQENIYLQKNIDGSYDIIIYADKNQMEAGFDFSGILKKISDTKKIVVIRTITVIVTTGIVFSVPFFPIASMLDSKYAMSYIYFGSVSQQINNANLSKDALSTVSPSYFDLNADGNLKLNNISKSFIDSMKANGMKVVPFISNHWNRNVGVAALNNVEALSDSIVDAIEQYDLDGVNVDIENVTQLHRDKYSALIKALREKLPTNKEVSVAVAANPEGWTTGWHGSYDYAELGKYADHLFLMTYDEHFQNGEAGPVASIDFVEKSIQYALQYVPKGKIVLGIPFFGRVWSRDSSIKGIGASLNVIDKYLNTYQNTKGFDSNAKSPYAVMIIKASDKKPVLNGYTLNAGEYTIWYENSDSIKQKLSLVNKYGIMGAGNWSAGQETADVWSYYEIWLNSKYFSDISDNFAKDSIVKLSLDGIIQGVNETQFKPNEPMTRAQVATVVTRVMGLPLDDNDNSYLDVTGHWADKEISAVTKQGILKGYEDGTFRPDKSITRAEMSVIMARMLELNYQDNTDATGTFTDLPKEHWAYNEILALAKLNIIRGYDDKTFRANKVISRGEVTVIIDRSETIE